VKERQSATFRGTTDPSKGFALAAALLAVMLIAALMASVFLAVNEETRISAVAGAKQLALSAAESAIERTILDWPATSVDPLVVGGVRTTTIDGFGVPVAISVTRLDSTLYSIVADAGRVSSGISATRRIGVIARARTSPDGSTAVDRIAGRWWSELF
jgi:type II secretory pathway pseudopilin PulG